MMRFVVIAANLAMMAAGATKKEAGMTLDEIRSEQNLEHRAQDGMLLAIASFHDAKTAYAAGDTDKTGRELKLMQAAVEVARDALDATGRNARKHPHPFKIVEQESKELLRYLDGLSNAMSVEDRPLIDGPKAKIQEIHDQWLEEIISGPH